MTLPADYAKQLNNLVTSFPSIMATFQNSYIIYNSNPGTTEYDHIYAQNKGYVDTANAALFTLTNNIQSSIDGINDQITKLDKILKTEKKSNEQAHKKLDEKNGRETGAEELIEESKEEYKYQYIKNITLMFGNVLLIYFIYKMQVRSKYSLKI